MRKKEIEIGRERERERADESVMVVITCFWRRWVEELQGNDLPLPRACCG